jgi:outer membrane assembly lipoprotein YfiO
MTPRRALALLVPLLGFVQFAPAANEPKTSELRGGRWVDAPAPATQAAATADPELDRIEQLIRRRRGREARKPLVRWLKSHRGSPQFDRALYLMSSALYQHGDRIKAFYYLDELMDEYPESSLFYQALEKQYQMADAYLDGHNDRLLGLPILNREDEAIDMLFRIQSRSPGSPLAEKALLRTADYYYFDRQYDLASDAYGFYIKQYPRSPQIAQVRLRQAFSNYAQFRGLKFDANPLVEARAQLMDAIITYPDLARQERLPSFVDKIDKTFAAKLYYTADFYRRTHEPRAAVYLYRYLVVAYPESKEASQAKNWLNRMPQWALETPAPGAPNEAATTQPAPQGN